jgi:uncharacterized protein YlxP (DUF503 family)
MDFTEKWKLAMARPPFLQIQQTKQNKPLHNSKQNPTLLCRCFCPRQGARFLPKGETISALLYALTDTKKNGRGGFRCAQPAPSIYSNRKSGFDKSQKSDLLNKNENEDSTMSKKKPLDERIKNAEQRLIKLKAAEKLKEQREKRRIAQAEKRERLNQAIALTREQDAHRKIVLGGVVIAAGADQMDPAELCGVLLMALRNLTPEKMAALREMGLQHFEQRSAERKAGGGDAGA